MSYSLALSGGGGGSSEEGVVRKLAAGQMVTVRLQPHGVNASNTGPVLAELDRAMTRLGIFRSPEVRGWGGGERTPTSAGLLVYKAAMKTSQYTAQQVADLVGPAIRGMEQALGAKRVSLVNITSPRATGDIVAPAPSPSPGDAGAPSTTSTPEDRPSSASEEPSEGSGFFTKKVGPVPVWAIGAGVLLLGGGLVVLGMRKRPAALSANASGRSRRRRSSRRSSRSLRPNGKRWYVLQVPVGSEFKVENALKDQIVARGERASFGDILVPHTTRTETVMDYTNPLDPPGTSVGRRTFNPYQGRALTRTIREAAYPGYIYVEIETPISAGARSVINSTGGHPKLLGGAKPTPVPDSEIEAMRESSGLGPEPEHEWKVGDRCVVKSGGFVGKTGVVKAVLQKGKRLSVELDLYGKATTVILSAEQVKLER